MKNVPQIGDKVTYTNDARKCLMMGKRIGTVVHSDYAPLRPNGPTYLRINWQDDNTTGGCLSCYLKTI